MKWPLVKITEICHPKQWPTISKAEMLPSGYPVFGANGQIGYYSKFNHEQPTILITCRGATCGSINVCEPKSYVTGNAMALDALDKAKADLRFVTRALESADFSTVITGVAQPQITRQTLSRLQIPLPPLAEQKRIAAILDAADALRAKRRETLAQLDTLLQSTFLDMFGDPVTNPKGWALVKLGDCGAVITGNTPSRKRPEYYGDKIEWIKSDNINNPSFIITTAEESLSEKGVKVARIAPKGSILVTCIAGSPSCIGNAAVTNRKVAFNQQINAFVPSENVVAWYVFGVFFTGKNLIQKASTNSMKGMVSKSAFSGIQIPLPPLPLQRRFAAIVESVEQQKTRLRAHLAELDTLFASLQDRAFKGAL